MKLVRGVAAAAAMGLCMAAGAGDAADTTSWTAVDTDLRRLVDGPGAPLGGVAVVVVEGGRVVHRAAYGCAIHPAEPGRDCDRPLTTDTLVRAASLSKVAMGVTAMILVGQGRLELDRDASDYLGFPLRNPSAPDVPITVRMLLDHSSSLRDGDIYALPVQYALTDLVSPGGAFAGPDRWAGGEEGRPGARFHYTNLNYGVLAAIIERITGERFDVVVERELLAPLGITAAFDVRRLPDPAFAALAPTWRRLSEGKLAADGQWTPQVDDLRGTRPGPMVSPFGVEATLPLSAYRPGVNGTTLSPQGGLRISADGLGRLVQLLLADGSWQGQALLPPGAVAEMVRPRWRHDPAAAAGAADHPLHPVWGTGLQCGVPLDHAAADRYCGHLGDAYGLLGGLFFDRERGRGFVYLITGTGLPTPPDHAGPLGPWEQQVATRLLDALERR